MLRITYFPFCRLLKMFLAAICHEYISLIFFSFVFLSRLSFLFFFSVGTAWKDKISNFSPQDCQKRKFVSIYYFRRVFLVDFFSGEIVLLCNIFATLWFWEFLFVFLLSPRKKTKQRHAKFLLFFSTVNHKIYLRFSYMLTEKEDSKSHKFWNWKN